MSNLTPGPDHAAKGGLLATLPGRTVIQGVLVDVLLAVCILIVNVLSSETPISWNVIWALVLKSVMMTIASSVMKRVKPPPVSAVK